MVTKNQTQFSIEKAKASRVAHALIEWFCLNARDLPWRRTRDPYAIWVSEIMLQQTQVKTVVPYWQRWMSELPDIGQLALAEPEKIHKLWEGLGYYTRVRNLHKAAQIIMHSHGGQFPQIFKDVLALPGIGPYTAGSICSIAFNQPTPILDGNVTRVLTRLFNIPKDPRTKSVNRKLWQIAASLVRAALESVDRNGGPACSIFNQSLMELGALVCTPRKPECGHCPVSRECVAYREGRVTELPMRGPRVCPTRQRFIAFLARAGGRVLVRQRPPGTVNAHYWEFPNVEVAHDCHNLHGVAKALFGFAPREIDRLCTIRHSITRYRITLEAYAIAWKATQRRDAALGRWVTLSQLHQLPLASAHRKLIVHLGL